MTDVLTGAELAERIESIVTWRPDLHDQDFWFKHYDDERKDTRYGKVTPDELPLETLLQEVTEMREEPVSCNTTLCVAGWALVLNGYEIRRDKSLSRYTENVYITEDYALKDGQKFDIYDKAAELLGISAEDGDKLFSEIHNDQAVEALSAISNGNPIQWEDILDYDEEYDPDYY